MGRDLKARLSDVGLAALAGRGADWPRSFVSSTPIPDGWMALVEPDTGRRRVLPAGDAPLPTDNDAALVLVRDRPLAIALEIQSAAAACGNLVDARCELLVRWRARDDDLAALRRSLLATASSEELPLARLAASVADSGGLIALRAHIAANHADLLVEMDTREALCDLILAHLRKFCFETGMTIERVESLRCASRTLAAARRAASDAADRVEQIRAREVVERAAIEATGRRVTELAALLQKLDFASASSSDQRWHEILPSLAPADRGRLLENLWRLTPARLRTRAIVAAVGNELVWLSPGEPEAIQARLALPDDLGGIRSVAFDVASGRLLAGAAVGVWIVNAVGEGQHIKLKSPAADTPRNAWPKTGFNSTAVVGNRLFAAHSLLGLCYWELAAPIANSPSRAGMPHEGISKSILEPHSGVPKTVRDVTPTVDGRVLFAADDCVHIVDPRDDSLRTLLAVDDTIHALALDGNDLYIGTNDGKILMTALNQPDDCWMVHRARVPIESLQVRRWNDLVELIAPAGDQGVVSIFAEQNVVSRLMVPGTPIRRAWASEDVVVGMSDRRDRLTVLTTAGGERRGREALLSRVLGSSIQDLCLLTEPAAPAAGAAKQAIPACADLAQ